MSYSKQKPSDMLLDVVAAEQSLYSGRVSSITATAELGELGIMPGHSALLSPLKPGVVIASVADANEPVEIFVSGGIIEVQPYHVTILADSAIRAADLDEEAVLASMERARAELQSGGQQLETSMALAELSEMAAQLRLIRRRSSRQG